MMKRIKLKSSVLASLAGLALFSPTIRESTLTDIAKPYRGIYTCKEARLGGEDLMQRFSDIKLELKNKGSYVLYYREKGEKKEKIEGEYQYDKKQEKIVFLSQEGDTVKREFFLDRGVLTVVVPYGGKLLCLQFEQA